MREGLERAGLRWNLPFAEGDGSSFRGRRGAILRPMDGFVWFADIFGSVALEGLASEVPAAFVLSGTPRFWVEAHD